MFYVINKNNLKKTEKHSKSANHLGQAAILNFVISQISRKKYICPSDILYMYHGRDITIRAFSERRIWPWALTLIFDPDLWQVSSEIWHRCWSAVPNFMKIGIKL